MNTQTSNRSTTQASAFKRYSPASSNPRHFHALRPCKRKRKPEARNKAASTMTSNSCAPPNETPKSQASPPALSHRFEQQTAIVSPETKGVTQCHVDVQLLLLICTYHIQVNAILRCLEVNGGVHITCL